MSGDTLSDLLRTVRLRGAVFYHVEGAAPWVAETPCAAEIIPGIMPGVEHMLEFHAVVSGSCWAAIVGETAVLSSTPGTWCSFPQGDAHVMSSEPGMRTPRADKDFFLHPASACSSRSELSIRDAEATLARCDLGGRECTQLVCGFLGLMRARSTRCWPPCRACSTSPAAGARRGLVGDGLHALGGGGGEPAPAGGEAVLERMSEMMFVEVLRRHIESLPPEETGWLAGMRDPAVGRALSMLHGKPGAPWSLERLSREAVGLSRSSLHERFVQLIGQPPMQYLTQWRMQVASGKLRDTGAKVIEVAMDVGYESEAAFSRAFKRVVGLSPATWRRSKRAPAV